MPANTKATIGVIADNAVGASQTEHLSSGDANRAILYSAAGVPAASTKNCLNSDDIINFHIIDPQAQKYYIIWYCDVAGTVINVTAFGKGSGDITYDMEISPGGTGEGTSVDIVGLTTETANQSSGDSIKASDVDASRDLAIGDRLVLNLTAVGASITEMMGTVKVTRP